MSIARDEKCVCVCVLRRRSEGEEQEAPESSASQRKVDGKGERVLYTLVRSGCGFLS
jgi:hypothetical protein